MTDTRCEFCAVTMHLVFTLGRRVQELESDLYRLVEHEPAPEPDYEALGYPETECRYTTSLTSLVFNLVGGPRIKNNETTQIMVDDVDSD